MYCMSVNKSKLEAYFTDVFYFFFHGKYNQYLSRFLTLTGIEECCSAADPLRFITAAVLHVLIPRLRCNATAGS